MNCAIAAACPRGTQPSSSTKLKDQWGSPPGMENGFWNKRRCFQELSEQALQNQPLQVSEGSRVTARCLSHCSPGSCVCTSRVCRHHLEKMNVPRWRLAVTEVTQRNTQGDFAERAVPACRPCWRHSPTRSSRLTIHMELRWHRALGRAPRTGPGLGWMTQAPGFSQD